MAQQQIYPSYPNQPKAGYGSGGGNPDGGGGYPGPPPVGSPDPSGHHPQGMPLSEMYDYDETSSRNHFVRRVFFLLSLMLAFSAGCIMCAMLIDSVRDFIIAHRYLIWVALGFYIVTSISIECCPLSRIVPWNYICLFLATLSMSFLTCCISVNYKIFSVAIAFLVTSLLCIVLTILACTSFDFTKYYIYLVAFAMIMMVFAVVFILVSVFFKYIKIMHIVYALLCTLLLSGCFLMEMQMILGGRTLELDTSEYVCGAFMLYSSIMNMFLNILRLLELFDS